MWFLFESVIGYLDMEFGIHVLRWTVEARCHRVDNEVNREWFIEYKEETEDRRCQAVEGTPLSDIEIEKPINLLVHNVSMKR